MGKKEKAALKEKRRFSNRQLVILSVILVSIVIFGSIISIMLLQTPNKFSLNAAIIDQLGDDFPNPQFVKEVTSILDNAGFNVTYYKSEELNVNFFKGLAKYNYGIIILRVHSALREDGSTIDLFTSEKFNPSNHVEELNNGLLVKGVLNYSHDLKEYFAFTSTFIESLEGSFPKSIVIAMGCWSLKPECKQMAQAFIKKSVEVYIGWTGLVGTNHTDRETTKLLRMLLEENKTIADTVDSITPDWNFPTGSKMEYHPQTAGSLKISKLIAEAKISFNHQSAVTLFKPVSAVCTTNFIWFRMRKKFRFDFFLTKLDALWVIDIYDLVTCVYHYGQNIR